jgi:multiple sugar transport system permease protein
MTSISVFKRNPRVQHSRLASGGSMLFMIAFAAYFLLPLWWLFVASSKVRGDLTTTPGLWFGEQFALFTNIGDVVTFNGGIFGAWVLNSVLYAGLGAVVGTLISAMAGYGFAKYVFAGRSALFNTILAGVLVPATALAFPLFLIFSSLDLTNTFWAVFLPSVVNPLGVYLARIYADAAIPDELIEASRLDGAGELRTFFRVTLPLMAPALVTIFLFTFVSIWNNFLLPLIMLQDERLFPVTLGLVTWNSQITQIPDLRLLVIVGSFISIVPLILAFLGLQRFWRTGLTAGSVK